MIISPPPPRTFILLFSVGTEGTVSVTLRSLALDRVPSTQEDRLVRPANPAVCRDLTCLLAWHLHTETIGTCVYVRVQVVRSGGFVIIHSLFRVCVFFSFDTHISISISIYARVTVFLVDVNFNFDPRSTVSSCLARASFHLSSVGGHDVC